MQIDAPPGGIHSWRQADTAAMARNYHEHGQSFGLPEVDWGGGGTGYVECEFPLYPYTVAAAYSVLGVHPWIARLAAALGFLVGALALYALVRDVAGGVSAIWALAFFLFLPLNLYYSRTIMPEAWMIGSSILGIYWFRRWTLDGRVVHLALATGFVALAALLKLPALYLGLPLAWMAWSRWGASALRKPALWAMLVVVLAATAAWYAHAHRIKLDGGLSFGVWEYGSDKWGNWQLVASWKFWNGILFRSIGERWLTWAGVPLFVAGLLLPRRAKEERLFDIWLLAIAIYFVVVARGNFIHEYYQFPLMPVAAAFLGRAVAAHMAPGRSGAIRVLVAVALLGVAVLSAVRWSDYLRREDPARSRAVAVARALQAATAPTDLVVTVESGNPTLLYVAHRKGWAAGASDLNPEFLDRAAKAGARAVAGTGERPRIAAVDSLLHLVWEGDAGYVLALRPAP